MSGFVSILDRSGSNLDPEEIGRLAEPLESRDGSVSSLSRGPLAIAIHHLAPSPDREHHGPLTDPHSGLVVAVAGRFRPVESSRASDLSEHEPAETGCASFALGAHRHGNGDFLAGVAGSFVLVTADPERGSLSVARDHLGDLKVYYYLDDRWLIAASEPEPILRHAAVSDDVDEHSVARFLGFRFSHCELSFFRQIRELPPAHRLRVSTDDTRIERYWRFRLRPEDREWTPARIRAEFLDQLEASVRRQTVDLKTDQVALSLSGGLDSTALAALSPPGVRAFSWYFDDATECDERSNIEAVTEHLGMPVQWVQGDGLAPLCRGFVDRFVHRSSPYLNAFAALKCRLYTVARNEGCRRIMVGDAGDALYSAREYWLREALTRGGPRPLASLVETARLAFRGDRFARRALRRLLPTADAQRGVRPRHVPWLTELALSYLPDEAYSPILPATRGRRRYDLVAGTRHSELESEEWRLFAQCGVDRGNPFWSWPLLETALNLPAWWYHRDETTKILTREAMKGLLPEMILRSERSGLLGLFFLQGIRSRRGEIREAVFLHPRSDWRRYVEPSWVEPYLDATESIQFGHTILWRVISYELWHRELIRPGRQTTP